MLKRLSTKKDKNINYMINYLLDNYLEPWLNGMQGPTDDNNGGTSTLIFPSVPTHKLQLPKVVLARTNKYIKYKMKYLKLKKLLE